MKDKDIKSVMALLRREARRFKTPVVTVFSYGEEGGGEGSGKDDVSGYDGSNDPLIPFRVLISCILSLRTKDDVTEAASKRLFTKAGNPLSLSRLKVATIEKLIYPAGFYRNKAVQIKEISRLVVRNYGGRVPDTIDELVKFKGVGRKTANLTVTLGYGLPGICVDIHVHRIMNRLGYISTKNPDATELALREKLPKRYWIPINDLLVTYGQNICKPVSPFCSECKLYKYCDRVGVSKSR